VPEIWGGEKVAVYGCYCNTCSCACPCETPSQYASNEVKFEHAGHYSSESSMEVM